MENHDVGERGFPPPGATPREDAAAVMKFYKLPERFAPSVLRAAEAARSRLSEPGERLDLRRKFIFTCDPASARDYDDALSLESDRRGNRVLGVHIADVSHFVPAGSLLDREARRRSTSVYLAERVVPMLPETLCDDLCSLVPGEDRLAFSVFMVFDREGRMVSSRFAKSVIRSRRRLTYAQVLEILEGANGGLPRREVQAIAGIGALARQLRQRRLDAGALDIEVPEADVQLDGNGEMCGLLARVSDDAHRMIEECMVAANAAVARELWTHQVKIVARHHAAPDEEKLTLLRAQMRALGIRMGDITAPEALKRFLGEVHAHPLAPVLSTMVLRSMKRAVYDAGAMGHWGLSMRYYAHFTSPIRRYPDLTLHRQLSAYLAGGPAAARLPPRELERIAAHATNREEIAAEAERGVMEIKKYRLLEAELATHGEVEYDALISRCTAFGCFVEIPAIAVSGLVHISRLSPGFVRFSERDQTLVAAGGRRWCAGESLRVKVARVDFAARRIDFVPADGSVRRQTAGGPRRNNRRKSR